MNLPERPPPRLVETPGLAGDCLRKVLATNPNAPDVPAFSALRERRQRRLQRQVSWGVALSAIVLVIGVRAGRHEEEALSVSAELTTAPAPQREIPEPSVKAEPSPALPQPTPSSRAEPEVSRPRVRAIPARAVPKPAEVVASAPHRSARACAELARGGNAEQALSCYADLANGNGITAELALFEQARLEGKALRRPEQALQTLETYRRRFPNGSLRAEVMLAQIDWLLRSGERARASQLVDEALASGSLSERRAELERLRDTLSAP